jgi:holo-[acyl-carrier protein] synthase
VTIFGIGVDIVEIARLSAAIDRHGESFLARIFTAEEQRYCGSMRDPLPAYAGRFAAKEAVAKAFGTGIGAQLGWLDIDIRRRVSGCPYVVLSGAGAEFAQQHEIDEVLISLTHAEHYAVAQAIAMVSTGSAG